MRFEDKTRQSLTSEGILASNQTETYYRHLRRSFRSAACTPPSASAIMFTPTVNSILKDDHPKCH